MIIDGWSTTAQPNYVCWKMTTKDEYAEELGAQRLQDSFNEMVHSISNNFLMVWFGE